MKKSIASRRVPRKIGRDDEDDDTQSSSASGPALEPVVKRPSHPSKPKRTSSLRRSIAPRDTKPSDRAESGSDDEESGPSLAAPGGKKSTLSRLAMERNAERTSAHRAPVFAALPTPSSAGADADRPSYSKEALAELKSSTPTTPQRARSEEGEGDSTSDSSPDDKGGAAHAAPAPPPRELDIAAKFGPLAALSPRTGTGSAVIPTHAEIREKKARRARLATQGGYISLHGGHRASDGSSEGEGDAPDSGGDAPSDDEFSRGIVPRRRGEAAPVAKRDKWGAGASRLVRDDEDVAEGFDEFVEDGGSGGGPRLALGKKAEREARRRRRTEMAEMIAEAEGGGGGEDVAMATDDSEAERNAAYEAAQTRAGTYGARRTGRVSDRPKRETTPPRIAPVPKLGDVLARFRARVGVLEAEVQEKERRLEELRVEKREVGESAAWVQSQLKETGERYEKLRQEAGLSDGVAGVNLAGKAMVVGRGLESIAAAPRDGMGDAGDG